MGDGSKTCGKCLESKPLDEFHRDKRSRDGHGSSCKACACRRAREWHERNPDYVRERARAYRQTPRGKALNKAAQERYQQTDKGLAAGREKVRRWRERNLTKARERDRGADVLRRYGLTLDEYREFVSRGCAICGKQDGQMCVDHDHKTGSVRDTLCTNCNLGIGNLKDNPELVATALAYLEFHASE